MTRSTLCFLLLALFFVSCQKDIKEKLNQPNEIISQENERLSGAVTKQSTQTWLNGYVLNEQSQPLAGASVTCGGKTVTTDSKGFFYFKQVLSVNRDYALINVTKAGYMNGFRTFTPNRNKLAYHTEKIILQTAGAPKYVPIGGGSIIADNIKLTFPSYAVMKPGGYMYSGNIKVVARYIDPTSPDFPLMVPGILSGLNSAGQINALQSLGMASVELFDDAGNKLEIAPGKTVRMELPAPAGGPASIPLWHFNESFGIWVQQGIATKQGNYYVADVNHFSVWNIDLEFNSFQLNLRFRATDSSAIVNQRVDVYRQNNIYIKTFFTDNAGEATLINCPSNEGLTLKISFPCDTISFTLAPVTQTRTETIVVNSPNLVRYELNGTIYKCNNQPLTNQAFQVFLTKPGVFMVLNGISDAQGRFNLAGVLPACQAGPLNAQTSAYYNNQYYFSGFSTVSPGLNNYNPTLCDTTGNGLFNDSDIVNIPDPALQQVVRQAINKPTGTIYYINVKNLRYLDASYLPIQTLAGIQYLTGLDSLDLFNTTVPITNISYLQTLTNLKMLDLDSDTVGNHISDLSPLQNLTSLIDLDLLDCGVSDISPLQNLTSMKELGLGDNQISNITPLQNLHALTYLTLEYNQISNIAPLQNLTALQYLYLSHNQVSNITPLQNLTALQELELDGNQVIAVTPLQNMAALQSLRLYNNQISTITALINKLPILTFFAISGNTVPSSEITAFQGTHPGCTIQ